MSSENTVLPQQLADYAGFVESTLKPEFDVVSAEAQIIRNEINDYQDLLEKLQSLSMKQPNEEGKEEATTTTDSSLECETKAATQSSSEFMETLVDLVSCLLILEVGITQVD
jgi:hypothetical protein